MATTSLPAPPNTAVSVFHKVLDILIEGLGADAAIALAIADQPWFGLPFVKQLFTFAVNKLAAYVDENLFKLGAKMIIRIQREGRKADFDKAIEPFLKPEGPTDEEIQLAKDAIDRLGYRGRV